MEKFNSCGQIQIWFVRQNLVFLAKIGPSAFMQSFCLVYQNINILTIFLEKIYIGLGTTPRIINTEDKNHFTNRQQTHKPTPNSKDSLGLTSSKYFAAIDIYQYSFVFSSPECGINSQNFKNKNTELLCAPRCRPDFMCQVLARRWQSTFAGPGFDAP